MVFISQRPLWEAFGIIKNSLLDSSYFQKVMIFTDFTAATGLILKIKMSSG